MANFISGLFKFAGRSLLQISPTRQFHALGGVQINNRVGVSPIGNQFSLDFVRTIVRNHFPKASERKRVKVHGWRTRLSTVSGRRVIMRRILKGRYYITH